MGILVLIAWCAVGYFGFSRRAARKEIAKMKKVRDFEMLPVQANDADEEEAVDGGADGHLLALPPPELDN